MGQPAPAVQLSLIPFTTAWLLSENHLASVPVAAYGIVLLAAAPAYYALQRVIIRRAVDLWSRRRSAAI